MERNARIGQHTTTLTNTPFQNRPRWRSVPPIRLAIGVAGLLLLLAGAALVLLTSLSIVHLPATWLNTLVLAFSILGVIFAFAQWLLPLSPSPGSRGSSGMLTSEPSTELDAFRGQLEQDLDSTLKKGTLVVYTQDHQVAQEIHLVAHHLWTRSPADREHLPEIRNELVKRYRVPQGYVCAAVFRTLDPDDYVIWLDVNHPTFLPVFAHEVTTSDWR